MEYNLILVEVLMEFYKLDKDFKYKDVEYAKGTDWEGIICSKYKGHQRAGQRIGNLRINIKSKKRSDFLTTFLSEWIITDKVASIFQENTIKGYELQPVEISNETLSYGLWELVVTGSGGDAHPDSGIHLKSRCKYCNHEVYSAFENGIIVDSNNWDGSDIFIVTGYKRYILITERLKKIIEDNKLTGAQIIPARELIWPKGVIKP
jgi:hypothetical protein